MLLKTISLEEVFPSFSKHTLDIPRRFAKGKNELLFQELVLTQTSYLQQCLGTS